MATRKRRWSLRKNKEWKKVAMLQESCAVHYRTWVASRFCRTSSFVPYPEQNSVWYILLIKNKEEVDTPCKRMCYLMLRHRFLTLLLRHKYILHRRVMASVLMKICEVGLFSCFLQFCNPHMRPVLTETDVNAQLAFRGRARPGPSPFCVGKHK